MLTMVLGGLWHGANWTFVLWGTLHGLYLVVNHGWLAFRERLALPRLRGSAFLAGTITFLAVVVAWVMFRAHDVATALRLLRGIAGLNGMAPLAALAPHLGQPLPLVAAWLLAGLLVVRLLPNSLELAAMAQAWTYRGRLLGFAVGTLLVFVVLNFNKVSTFIYFQF